MRWRIPPERERSTSLPPNGDFERTILPHLNAAYNLARWLVRDEALAEDVVQDAFLRALSYFNTYHGGDPRAWLLRIVRNVAYGQLAVRRQGITTSLDDVGESENGELVPLQVADPADNPEAALFRTEAFGRLDRALAALPPELRECLVLHELEELPYKDIARITGVPIGTVMSRLWRARQALMRSERQGEQHGVS